MYVFIGVHQVEEGLVAYVVQGVAVVLPSIRMLLKLSLAMWVFKVKYDRVKVTRDLNFNCNQE